MKVNIVSSIEVSVEELQVLKRYCTKRGSRPDGGDLISNNAKTMALKISLLRKGLIYHSNKQVDGDGEEKHWCIEATAIGYLVCENSNDEILDLVCNDDGETRLLYGFVGNRKKLQKKGGDKVDSDKDLPDVRSQQQSGTGSLF